MTGATGYLGGRTIPLLQCEGHEVIAVVRPTSDAAAVARLGIATCPPERLPAADTLVHLATFFSGQTLPGQPAALVRANVDEPTALVERFVDAGGTRVVAAGTAWEDCGDDHAPANFYAASKAAFRVLGAARCRERGCGWMWLRFADLVGPDDPRRRLFHAIGESLRDGRPLPMTPGDQPFDPVAVDDGAAAVAAAVAFDPGRVVTVDVGIAGQSPASLRQKVQTIFDRRGRPELPRWGDRPYRRGEPFTIHWRPAPAWWRPRRSYESIVDELFTA